MVCAYVSEKRVVWVCDGTAKEKIPRSVVRLHNDRYGRLLWCCGWRGVTFLMGIFFTERKYTHTHTQTLNCVVPIARPHMVRENVYFPKIS